jgi:hypothetical protein
MRLHERLVKAAVHNGWRAADPTYERLTFIRGLERLRVWADARGNVERASYDIGNGDVFWRHQVWAMDAGDRDKTESVLRALEAQPLGQGRFKPGEHVVNPLNGERWRVRAVYYGTAMHGTMAIERDGASADYVPCKNYVRTR